MSSEKSSRSKEILKCGRDTQYFLYNYAKVDHPTRGMVPFKTYPFQDDLLKEFVEHKYNVILKARQLGISTIVAGYVAWFTMYHKDKNVLIMATKRDTAINLLLKIKLILKSVPTKVKLANVTTDNRTSLELSNGSKIKAISTSSDAGRSEALSLLVIDEAAHIENMEELWTGLYSTLSTGGSCIALSTPNGVGNWFHKTCIDAEEKKNNFQLTTLPWHVHPERDQEWFEEITVNSSQKDVAQEHLCNFNMSGETVIDGKDIDAMESLIAEPEYKTWFDRNYHIWEKYNPEKTYLLVADVARGDGKDYSAFHIIDTIEMTQVAEYQGKLEIDHFADLLLSAGSEYGECMIAIETNNLGYAVAQKLVDAKYPNIFYSSKGSNNYVEPYMAENMANVVPGFTTSNKSRPLIVAKLEESIRNKFLTIRSLRLVNELRTFIYNNKRPEAMKGYNDDLVMSMAIACYIRDTTMALNYRSSDYNKALAGSFTISRTSLNTAIPGMLSYEADKRRKAMREKERKAQEDMSKYNWIYKK